MPDSARSRDVAALDDLDGEATPSDFSHERAGVAAVTPQVTDRRPLLEEAVDQLDAASAVLDAGFMDHEVNDEAECIYGNMALAPLDSLRAVPTSRPPFSVVLAVWLSMIAAVGSGARPSRTLPSAASTWCIRSKPPRTDHVRNAEYTVCQGGNSEGRKRQALPVRMT